MLKQKNGLFQLYLHRAQRVSVWSRIARREKKICIKSNYVKRNENRQFSFNFLFKRKQVNCCSLCVPFCYCWWYCFCNTFALYEYKYWEFERSHFLQSLRRHFSITPNCTWNSIFLLAVYFYFFFFFWKMLLFLLLFFFFNHGLICTPAIDGKFFVTLISNITLLGSNNP